MPAAYMLARCPNCQGPILAETEEVAPEQWSDPTIRYPSRGQGADPTWPSVLAARFAEAEACLRARAFNAAAVMCRRTMEQVCMELNATGRTLYEKLGNLHAQGLLEPSLLEWANGLRALGNVGAHAGTEDVEVQDARDALDFSRAVIDYVFAYKKKFEQFRARRGAPSVS